MRKQLIIVAIFTILLGLSVRWFFIHFDRVPVTDRSTPSIASMFDHYLALKQLAKQHGYNIVDHLPWNRLLQLSPRSGVLIIPRLPSKLPASIQAKLMAWRRNGHTISGMAIPTNWRQQTKTPPVNPLLKDWHLTLGKISKVRQGTGKIAGRKLEFILPDTWRLMEYDKKGDLTAWDYTAYYNGMTAFIMLPNFNIFSNKHIAKLDNALLFLSLLDFHLDRTTAKTLYFIDRPASPGLVSLLWRYFSFAIIALGLLVLLAIWHVSVRFGPIVSIDSHANRELREHLLATGRWSWLESRASDMLDNSYHFITTRMRLIRHDWDKLDSALQCALLQQTTALESKEIMPIWPRPEIKNSQEFVQLMLRIQFVRKNL